MKTVFLSSLAAFLFISCNTITNSPSKEFVQTQQELTSKLTEISKTATFNGFGVALVNDKELLY